MRSSHALLSLILLAVLVFSTTSTHAQVVAPAATPDLGDAPDSTNSLGGSLNAYPGVTGRFPTVAATVGGSLPGPLHRNQKLVYYLGSGISAEEQADGGADADGINNIRPLLNSADHDTFDDGLVLPGRMGHCVEHTLVYRVTSLKPAEAFLNVWIDWDRNGAWETSNLACPGAQPVAEWAVQNRQLQLATELRELRVTIRTWRPDPDTSIWLRVSLSDTKAPTDGSGPPNAYALGETEDYLLELAGLPEPLTPATIRPQAFTALIGSGAHQIFLPFLRAGGSGPPSFDPPIGTPSGQLREVDVAHIGGSPLGPTRAIVVTAAGSGAGVRLSSWTIDNGPQTPMFLQDGPSFPGHDVKLHVLTPDVTPKLEHELLLSAVIRDGNLWLTSWRLNASGRFTQLGTRGYGSNAEVAVEAYAIAHRELRRDGDLDSFAVITPVRTANNQLRMITWSVNATSGAINGLRDSGDWGGDPDQDTQLAATKIAGDPISLHDYFAVSYRSGDNLLTNTFWGVTNAGVPEYRGIRVSGLDIRGDDTVEVAMRDVAIAPLTDMGFLSATRDSQGATRLISWDNQLSCYGDGGCGVTPHFVSDDAADEDPGGFGVQIDAPSLTANRALLLDAFYEDELFERNIGSTGFQGIASVTKVMTLILTLEAIANGSASLDDLVVTSKAAADVGGSQLGLIEGEVQTLETMLYGLMVPSGNDAAIAIAEHIGGDQATFVALMNDHAADLNMADSIYCQPAGGCFSTPTDQVALWRSVYTNPVFQQFTGPVNYVGCGEGPADEEICHFIDKAVSIYPGQESWKSGSLGFFCGSEPTTDGVPLCASNGCLSAQATRLDRTLLQNILQPQPLDANIGSDSRALWDYGYQRLYTPDARGDAEDTGAAPDFGLDSVNDTLALTAAIDGQNVRLCTWDALTWTGQISQVGCATHAVNGLAASPNQPPPTEIDVVLRSTLESDGDYLVGHRDGDDLMLTMWRLGPHE